jgi:hypothetical protein
MRWFQSSGEGWNTVPLRGLRNVATRHDACHRTATTN